MLLLLELRVLWCFVLDGTDLIGLLAFSLFPFTFQESGSPCCVDGGTNFIEGRLLYFSRGVFSLRNDLHDSIKGEGDLGEEEESLDVVCDQIGCILEMRYISILSHQKR